MEASQIELELISYEKIAPDKQFIYKELEKHLYLGQWEFARALILTILSDDPTENDIIKEILRKVALNPDIARIQDPIPSKNHLAWLACQLLQQISPSEDRLLKKYAEFCVLLHDLLPEACPTVVEELQIWYSEALNNMTGSKEVTAFSPDCCSVLQTSLLQNPSTISSLMEKLIISCESFQSTNTQIYAIYLQSIAHCIKQIEGYLDTSSSVSVEKKNKSIKKVLCLFNVFPELEEPKYGPEVEKLLTKHLCDLVKLRIANVIDATEIYSVLLTRKSPRLLQMFSVEDDRLFSQAIHCQNKETQLYCDSDFSTDTNRESWFREAYLQCINHKTHFLSIIMDGATKCLLEGKLEDAWNLMENPLLHRLQPLIIILAWESCSTDKSANNVLDVVKAWKPVYDTDPLFCQILFKLQYNLHITDWCLEKLRSLHPNCNDNVLISKRRNIFNQLLSQSPLRILHKTIGLKNISYNDMLSLLKFSKEEVGKSGRENLLVLSNSMVFHGYLAIMHVMDAIGACCEIEQLSALKSDNRKNTENWSISSCDKHKDLQEDELLLNTNNIETHEDNYSTSQVHIDELSVEGCVDKYGFQLAYSHFVTERLQKAKSELNQIYPIEFRMEILENIFSLLFVTGNDFQENDTNHYDSEDYSVGEKQHNIKSDQVSSRQSSGSTSGISKSGFLCNELVVRDILIILKESHLDTSSASYRILAEKRSSNEKETEKQSEKLNNSSLPFIKSSITKYTLQERMSKLLKYINEAQWRFELVTSDLVPREFGMCGKYFCKKSKRAPKFTSVESAKKSGKESEHFSSSSGREDGKLKRRSHKHSTHYTSLGIPAFQEAGFIHYMLSSPSDLLCHSLWRKNYDQAKQVIQIFNLQTTHDATEVYFSENYEALIKEIESTRTKQKSFVRQGTAYLNSKDNAIKRFTLDQNISMGVTALAEAAAAGVQSTTITSLVDKMLNPTQSPAIPDFIELKENKIISNLLAECKELHGVVLADCAYTANTTLDMESMLLQISMKRMKFSTLAIDHNVYDTKQKLLHSVKGIVKILEQNSALSNEVDKHLQMGTPDFPSFFMPESARCRNLMTMLGSLDHKTYREQTAVWQRFIDKLNEVEMLLEQDSKEKAEHNTERAPEAQNKLHQSFQELSKICAINLRLLTTEIIPNKGHKYLNYLKIMYDHICHVSRALIKCRSHSYSADNASYTSYFSVLRESPSDVLSKMMLQNGIPPAKLENFAAQMKVDLVHIITQKCFPYIPSSLPSAISSETPVSYDDIHSKLCIILNCSGNTWSLIRHPELAVREILSDVLSLIHDECMATDSPGILTMSIAISLLKEARLQNWMMSTVEIAHIDMSLLKSREEKLAFFGNLCNIMWIHAIFKELDLAIHLRNDDLHHLRNIKLKTQALHLPVLSSNIVERLTNQKIYAYQIGESHVLSLLDLRYHILHTGLPFPTHVTLPALSYLFDFSDDDEMVVGVEPRLLFAICEGFVSSPKLQVLYPETVISQLDDAMRDYLCFHVETNCEEEKVMLPQLLNWYSQDFAGDDDNDWSRANYEGLVTLISSYVRGNMQDDLQSLLSLGSIHGFSEYIDDSGKKMLPFSVEFKPFITQFGIIFDYDATKLENLTINYMPSIVEKPDYYQICQQTHIIQYLRNKCWMLSEFLGMMDCENSKEPMENEEYKTKSSTIKLTPETPLMRLMCHVQEIWHKCMGDCTKHTDLIWIVSALTPHYYKGFIWDCLDACIRREDWSAVNSCLSFVESINISCDYRLIKDILLQHLASFVPGAVPHFSEPWSYALQISDSERKAKCILSNIIGWPEEICLKVLKACLADEKIINHSELHDALSMKLKEISLYQKIIQVTTRVVKFELPKVNFSTWQDIARLSIDSPKVLLECIRNTEQFHLSMEWAKIHPVGPDIEQLLAEMHISWLLDQDPPKTSEAEQILQSLNIGVITSICHTLIKTLNSCESKIFLVQYILKHLDVSKENNEKEELNKLFVGLKIMSAVKEIKRRQYEHLIYYPHLLVEQLLMNMQIDTVEKALKLITNVPCADDILPVNSIDGLLEQYAEKAIEIPVVEEVIGSSSSDNSSASGLPATTEKFIMPLNVPKKNEWVPDSQVRNCMVCLNQQFSMFNRRHHCRRCGRIVCTACSQHRVLIEGYDNALVRICDECYEQTYPGNAEESSSYSPSSLDYRMKYSSTGQLSPKYYNIPQRENNTRRKTSVCVSTEIQWLGKDETNNMNIREEFYYEQAPSVSLCLSILKLHSDLKKCSSFVLGLCNKLFNMLIPKVPKTPNPEIDYGLMISIIRSLLLNIKLKLSEADNEDAAEYVDTYSTFLDLIKQLVNENCVHLLPEDSITSDVAIRKLRDALRKDERMTLALEVSAKYSLDTFGIWASWGKTFLQIGDWIAAREKFSHCLKKPKDRSQSQNESALLKDILNLLENAKHHPNERNKSIMKSLSSLHNIQNGIIGLDVSITFRQDKLDHLVLKECLYYLENYGYHLTYVSFYQRHNMICEAVNYIMKERCDTETFIEGLFLPCAKSGILYKLKTAISSQDSSLRNFRNYFIGTCKYLEKNDYYNLLYDVQLYMKDYIRAAMTNMWFFQEPAENYTDLAARLNHMSDAKKSLETYIKSQESSLHDSNARREEYLFMLPEDKVKKHIRKIDLQIKTTKYFAEWELENKLEYPLSFSQNKEADSDSYAIQEVLPTLLGGKRTKSCVAAMMIINCKEIKQGLNMASEIIQEFQLNWADIIGLTSSTLIKCNCWDKVPCLIECACKDYNFGNCEWDEIIITCIKTSVKLSVENAEIEKLISLISSNATKIKAYILCGKLMSAYLLANKNKRVSDVQEIMIAAKEKSQDRLSEICEQWLQNNTKKSQN